MPVGSVAVKERHQPLGLVDTAGFSEEEWLAYRRKGIGGSDVAAVSYTHLDVYKRQYLLLRPDEKGGGGCPETWNRT